MNFPRASKGFSPERQCNVNIIHLFSPRVQNE